MDRAKIFEQWYQFDKTIRGLKEINQELYDEMARSAKEDEQKDKAFALMQTIKANVYNDKLSDADFRQFIKNSLK